LVGVVDGSMAGGGVGALREYDFSYSCQRVLILVLALADFEQNHLCPGRRAQKVTVLIPLPTLRKYLVFLLKSSHVE
jgi:hypothetical protein